MTGPIEEDEEMQYDLEELIERNELMCPNDDEEHRRADIAERVRDIKLAGKGYY